MASGSYAYSKKYSRGKEKGQPPKNDDGELVYLFFFLWEHRKIQMTDVV